MKKLNFLLLLLLPLLYSCSDNCEGIDCLSEDAFAFTIKSEESGKDLLFGSEAQLAQNEVEVYYMVNGSRQDALYRYETSHVLVALNQDVTEYFVTAVDRTDTIRVESSRTAPGECCPSTTMIERIIVNGTELREDTWVIELSR